MTKKPTVKTIIIIVIMLLVGVLGVLGIKTAKTLYSGASSVAEPKNVLAKVNDDGKSAVITWISDKASMGIVEYGTTPASLLLRAPESEEVTNHAVTLSALKANTNYYFRIRVGEELFDNNGIPYSFKTKEATPSGIVLPVMTSTPTPTASVGLRPSPSPAVGGVCDRKTDYNGDGVVNSLDYIHCQKGRGRGVVTPVPAKNCSSPGDLNNDGVVNSLDIRKCLQNQ